MNLFDLIVILSAVAATIFGFRSGLVRSAATILGYVCAAPFAVKAASFVSDTSETTAGSQGSVVFFAAFLLGGLAISAGFRMAIDEMVGAEISLPDRLAGSTLGALRCGLIAVTVVIVFDRLIPAGSDPAFLAGSQLRPILSLAGQRGLNSLPPETAAFIDRIRGRRQI